MALCAEVVAVAGLTIAEVPAECARVLTRVGEGHTQWRTACCYTCAKFCNRRIEYIDKGAVTNCTNVVFDGNVIPTRWNVLPHRSIDEAIWPRACPVVLWYALCT